jgi:hypothetical protein
MLLLLESEMVHCKTKEIINMGVESELIIEDGIVKNGRSCTGDVVVPEGVTAIADKAFNNNKQLTGLHLPEGLVSIGKNAVSGCINLVYVDVPGSVTQLGEGGLVKSYESDVGFTHVMESKEQYPEIRCKMDSWIDQKIQEIQKSDVHAPAFSILHLAELKYL